MPEQKTPVSGAFWLASLMYFCSGKPMHFCSGVDTKNINDFRARCAPCRDFAYCLNETNPMGGTADGCKSVLGFADLWVSANLRSNRLQVADPVLIVIGLPGLVFITQGPSGHVKHP